MNQATSVETCVLTVSCACACVLAVSCVCICMCVCVHSKENYYPRYGRNSTGFTKYVREQIAAWNMCMSRDSPYGVKGDDTPPYT